MLCQSHSLGVVAGYENIKQQRDSAQLLSLYQDHIHLLHINKKIESQEDYKIFDEQGEFKFNEENRDY